MEIPADWRRFCAAFIEAVGANGRLFKLDTPISEEESRLKARAVAA
jgi:hypothetical protein